jgi:hypothetical protein
LFSVQKTGSKGDDREVTGRAGRAGRRKQNHVFATEVREKNFVFADVHSTSSDTVELVFGHTDLSCTNLGIDVGPDGKLR